MADVYTLINDVIVPEIFEGYTINKVAEQSRLMRSGILTTHPDVNVGANLEKGGHVVHIPYWNEFSGRSQELTEGRLEVNKMTSGQDVAVAHFRANAWGFNDFAFIKSADDPMDALASGLARYWERDDQVTLVKTLTGALGSFADEKIKDISGKTGDAALIGKTAFTDTSFLMGDNESQITATAMHSNTVQALVNQGHVEKEYEVLPGGQQLEYQTYLGKRIIVDDTMPVDTSGEDPIYTTFLFGEGAVCYDTGTVRHPIETDRDSLSGNEVLISRRAYVMHIRGIKWGLSVCENGTTPSDSELVDTANWTPVYDPKKIRVVALKHKI